MNAYGFAGGDRVNFSDPFGLCPVEKDGIPCGLSGAAIGAAVGTGVGAIASIGCAVVTIGICAAGSPAIVSGAAGAGGIIGGLLGTYNEMAGGRTASGGYTDEHGNELGPSGKPKVNQVNHATRKQAKDAARNGGKGAPVNHPTPTVGDPHYHPTGADGKKIPGSTHHNYPPG